MQIKSDVTRIRYERGGYNVQIYLHVKHVHHAPLKECHPESPQHSRSSPTPPLIDSNSIQMYSNGIQHHPPEWGTNHIYTSLFSFRYTAVYVLIVFWNCTSNEAAPHITPPHASHARHGTSRGCQRHTTSNLRPFRWRPVKVARKH